MKNLWPDRFSENDHPTAKSLFEEQGKLLPKLNNGTVFAEVEAADGIKAIFSEMTDEFVFKFDILGKFLPNYRFNVLTFSHDITLYPVKLLVDEKIGAEIGLVKKGVHGYRTEVDSPEALEDFARRVLTSARLGAVIGSIMRLSK